ncbi:c-type cytochrome [Halomonas sp. M20]|uniref:c-type cytochrome n=1 Tax=Halomonas sp. M20 TaxID=2763264 RepID=UPI001D0A3DC6|nr:c-type cytochrome [Halomonas sp. M20]
MRQILVSLALIMGFSTLAQAAVEGDPAAGKEKAQVCAACHGQQGNSAAPTFPNIAGQQPAYMVKQITEIRDGVRPVPEMAGIVANLDEQDIADLSAFYANQELNLGQADPALVDRGKSLYKSGDLAKGIPACMACHMPTGVGVDSAKFPALSGQHPEYTASTLQDYAKGERSNDPNAIMRNIASKMSDADMEAVASYVNGLH